MIDEQVGRFRVRARPIPSAELPNGGRVPDPELFDTPLGLMPPGLALNLAGVDADYLSAQARAQNTMANLATFGGSLAWGIDRIEHAGRKLVIVGRGPSAARLSEVLASLGPERPPQVLALNGAIELVERVYGPAWWLLGDEFLVEANIVDHARLAARLSPETTALFSTVVPPVVAQMFPGRRHWWLFGSGGVLGAPAEDLLPVEVRRQLARFLFLRTASSAALHLGWWLGFHEIHLIGCECSCPVDGRWYSAHPAGDDWERSRPDSNELATGGACVVEGVDGPVQTTAYWLQAHAVVDALAMFLVQSGLRLVDHSRGLRYESMALPEDERPQRAGVLEPTPLRLRLRATRTASGATTGAP